MVLSKSTKTTQENSQGNSANRVPQRYPQPAELKHQDNPAFVVGAKPPFPRANHPSPGGNPLLLFERSSYWPGLEIPLRNLE